VNASTPEIHVVMATTKRAEFGALSTLEMLLATFEA
jgi:hypothetical protein